MKILSLNTDDNRVILSMLWAFLFINLLLQSNGIEDHGLFTSLVLELQLALIVLCHFLAARTNTLINVGAALLSLVFIVNAQKHGQSDYLFALAQCVGSLMIIWFAWLRDLLTQFIMLLAPPVR